MIEFQSVTKKFPSSARGIEEVSFTVKRGKTLVLLGPSGSGKTTALRLINRLIDPTSGIILFDGANVLEFDPIELRRKIGYAIQHIGLFPHMSVEENIGVVPKLLGWSKEKVKKRSDELLDMVGLEPDRFCSVLPAQLSGGQKQRVGVARALAADPPVILMDEPFAALDPLMREQMQNEFLQIQAKIQKTIVFVTHDMSEAVKMGDEIAVFKEGRLVQLASPEELLHNPSDGFIDQFFGRDRLQLLLQTKSLRYFLKKEQGTSSEKGPKLSAEATLLEALKVFKETGAKTLDVVDNQEHLGQIDRNVLFDRLIGSL